MKINSNLIDFFKRHNLYDKKVFNYIEENSVMIDYRDEEQWPFIGCFYVLDGNNILKRFQVNMPYVFDDVTALISVHEIVHGIECYKKLGKWFEKDVTIEVLPMFYEKLYMLENASEELLEYCKYLDEYIDASSDEEHRLALKIRDELLKEYKYNYDLYKMEKLSKKLVKKNGTS